MSETAEQDQGFLLTLYVYMRPRTASTSEGAYNTSLDLRYFGTLSLNGKKVEIRVGGRKVNLIFK